MPEWTAYIPLLLIIAIFWLFIVRPARRRQQEFAALQAELAAGMDVVTTSGIFGQIVAIDDETALLRIAEGVEIRIHRHAIGEFKRPEDHD